MSYDSIRKIRIQRFVDEQLGIGYDKVDMEYSCSNDTAGYGWAEWGTNIKTLEGKVNSIFSSAIDGCIRLLSTTGRFYKFYKTIDDLDKTVRKYIGESVLEFDFQYKTDFYEKKKSFLADYATDLYFKREPRNFELFLEDFSREFKNAKEQKAREWKEKDMVPIRSASMSELFGSTEYDVVADYDDNLYLCKSEQYASRGILTDASKAIKFPNKPHLSMLYGVLSGSYTNRYKGEVLEWYDNRPLHKAAVDVQMSEIQKLLNSMELPPYVKLPWKDFDKEAVA